MNSQKQSMSHHVLVSSNLTPAIAIKCCFSTRCHWQHLFHAWDLLRIPFPSPPVPSAPNSSGTLLNFGPHQAGQGRCAFTSLAKAFHLIVTMGPAATAARYRAVVPAAHGMIFGEGTFRGSTVPGRDVSNTRTQVTIS